MECHFLNIKITLLIKILLLQYNYTWAVNTTGGTPENKTSGHVTV
jgi:hypothetical protein